MPPVAAAIGLALFEAGIIATIGGVIAFTSIVSGIATSFIVGAIASKLLFKKPPTPSLASGKRTITFRSPTEPRRVIYGTPKIGGPILYITTTDNNDFLHLVIALASHKVEEIGDIFFGDSIVELDANNIATGEYSGSARINKHLGAWDQLADADLVNESEEWTEDHRLRGIAYIYVRLKFSRDVYPSGVPNITAIVKGRKPYDPREGAHIPTDDSTWEWTDNAEVCRLDYLRGVPIKDGSGSLVRLFGIGASDSEIDLTLVPSQANICDELVTTAAVVTKTFKLQGAIFTARNDPNPSDDRIKLTEEINWNKGHLVRLTTTGTLPTPLVGGTTYYVIPVSTTTPSSITINITDIVGNITFSFILFNFLHPNGVPVTNSFKLATSASNAADGIFLTITDAGTGVHTIIDNSDRVEPADTEVIFNDLDAVTLTTTDTLPSPLLSATTYYLIRTQLPYFKFATSVPNARKGIAITLTGSGIGEHTLNRAQELRYTANGTVDLDQRPRDILQAINSASGGFVTFSGGLWRGYVAAFRTPTVTIDDNDLRGGIKVQPRVSRRELFNAIRGVYIDPSNNYQPADFPPVTNALYVTQDNGEQIWTDIELPYTISASRAQRLAKILLEKTRQQISVSLPLKLTGLRTLIGDTVRYTNTRKGFSAKEFEILEWQFAVTDDSEGNPYLGVDAILRETASAVYDWNSGEETIVDLAPNTNLPNPFFVTEPTGLIVTEELYTARDGGGLKVRAVMSWTAAADAFVTNGGEYETRYKLVGAAEYIHGAHDEAITQNINDLTAGSYVFEVRSHNSIGVHSIWVPKTQEIFGLAAPPTEPQNLTISTIGGLAILRWTKTTDLDVFEGGEFRFRWSPALTGATWQTSTSIGEAVDGKETATALPLKRGTYLVKAVDTSGIRSLLFASVTTKQATVIAYTNVGLLTEDPTFLGTKVNVIVTGVVLKLDAAALISTWGLIDSIVDWDSEGGIVASGTYSFSGSFDFGSVVKRRLTSDLTVAIINTLDLISSRTTPIDTWEDFDGGEAASADAVVDVRQTDDDPTGSPTWSTWERLDSMEVEAWGLQFRCRLVSTDPAYNIEVSEMSVSADRIT